MKQIVIGGVTYLLDQAGYYTRRFVKLDAQGLVVGDLECARKSWAGVAVPADLTDVTTSAQWNGIGSLTRLRRLPDGTFVPPEAA